MRIGDLVLAASVLAATSGSTNAAEITITHPVSPDQVGVFITGPIEPGDDQRLFDLLEADDSSIGIVFLDSPGGSLDAGLSIAAEIHERRFDTQVLDDVECYSVCALIWIAGRKRNITADSIIGVHAAYRLDEEGQGLTSGSGNASVGGFLNALGIPLPAIRYITEAGADDVLPITPDIARRLGIDVYEFRGERIVTPAEEPSSYGYALEAASLIGMTNGCDVLFDVDGGGLQAMAERLIEESHGRFGGEVFLEAGPYAIDVVKSGQDSQGLKTWCLNAEAELRKVGLEIGIDSPSFDCAKAETATERTICDNPDLWPFDRALANLYFHARDTLSSSQFELIRDDQADWIGRRNRCRDDVDCLGRSYWTRITEIDF